MGLFSKAYKIIYNISQDASESVEVDQDDCYADGDYDALPLSLNGNCRLDSDAHRFYSKQAFWSTHYSIPDSPPPDFI